MFITNKFYFCFKVQFNLNYLCLLLLSQFFKNISHILNLQQKKSTFKLLCDENPVQMLYSTNKCMIRVHLHHN